MNERNTEPLRFLARLVLFLSCLLLWVPGGETTLYDEECNANIGRIDTGSTLIPADAGDVSVNLEQHELSADDCLWLHQSGVNWEIVVD